MIKYFKYKVTSPTTHYLFLIYDANGRRINGYYSYYPFSISDTILPQIFVNEGHYYEIYPDELPDQLKVLWGILPQAIDVGDCGDERDFQKYNIS